MDLFFKNNNNILSTILVVVLVLYASTVRPNLPSGIKKLFDNPIFRVSILAFIVYRAKKNLQLAIMIAIAFTVTLNVLSDQEINESFQQIEKFKNESDNNL